MTIQTRVPYQKMVRPKAFVLMKWMEVGEEIEEPAVVGCIRRHYDNCSNAANNNCSLSVNLSNTMLLSNRH